jgi:hypothetical protein
MTRMSVNNGKGREPAVYIPYLHRNMVSRAVPGWVRFLEPGLEKVVPEENFQPLGLPFPPAQARRFLEESIRFGEQFRNPEEMRYFGVVPMEDFYSQTSMAIRSRLTAVEAPEGPSPDLLRAQKTLLLQWFFEERQMEMHSLEKDIGRSMDNVEGILGIDDENEKSFVGSEENALEGALESTIADAPLLEAFLTVIPEEMPLFTVDSALLERLRDMGVSFEKDETDKGLLMARITGATLVGGRSGMKTPWHTKTYSILTLPS